ncbi:MAG: TIGR03862 family flavoprotein, partial [Bacteroidia bacterium]
FISRYTPSVFLEPALHNFTNENLRGWLKEVGVETFVGTSKRVFPVKGIKPIDVLNAILERLKQKDVQIKTKHEWLCWNENDDLVFDAEGKKEVVRSDFTVFSLGGSSWKKTGSDGSWKKLFEEKGVPVKDFLPSNCAYEINWGENFLRKSEGRSLKNISVSCGNKTKKGELVITKFGIEGGAVYALSPEIRSQFSENSSATIYLDLKPDLTPEEIKMRLSLKGKKSQSKLLADSIGLSGTQIELLKCLLSKEEFTHIDLLSEKIKHLPIQIVSVALVDDAISTVGGISLEGVNEFFELKNLKNNFVIGEMLDWDAPTGGYLLQACFSMGAFLGRHLNAK